MHDIIIIGAGCAGLTAAVYALRAGKSVLIIEKENIGGQISHSPLVENFPGFISISGSDFSNRLFEQAMSFGADFEIDTVIKIEKTENGFIVLCESGEFESHRVIIATGLKHRRIEIARENELIGHGISYCAICDGAFYKGREVAVVGGGNAALQNAIFLSAYCKKVYLIHRRTEFRAEKELVNDAMTHENIEFILNSVVSELIGESELTALGIFDVNNEQKTRLEVDALFVSIGHIPENAIFSDLVKLDSEGFIDANEDCRTSCEGIFAAGDCRRKKIRQLTTAAADGAVAALAACNQSPIKKAISK